MRPRAPCSQILFPSCVPPVQPRTSSLQESHSRCLQEPPAGGRAHHALHGGGGGRVRPRGHLGVRRAEASAPFPPRSVLALGGRAPALTLRLFLRQVYRLHPTSEGEIRAGLQPGGEAAGGADGAPAGGASAQRDPPHLSARRPAREVRPEECVEEGNTQTVLVHKNIRLFLFSSVEAQM